MTESAIAGEWYKPTEGWRQWARHASAEDRARLADALGERSSDPQLLASQLSRPEYLAEHIRRLAPEAADVLWQLWIAGGRMPVETVVRTDATGPALKHLADVGLVAQLTHNYYTQSYAYPAEAHPFVRRLIAAPRLRQRAVPASEPAVEPVPANPVWLTDVFRVLSQIRWQGARLTQQGLLYKRWEQTTQALLTGEHPPSREARLSTAIQFASYAGLLVADPAQVGLHVTTDAPEFFSAPPARRWQRWSDFVIHQLSTLPFGPLILDSLAALPPDQSLTARDWVELAGAGRSATVQEHFAQLATATLNRGVALGWLRVEDGHVQVSAEARAAIRGLVAPEAPARAIMEPTGDVMVPKETPLGRLWAAEEVLTLYRADVVWIYRCDTAARERAHDYEISADEILTRIQTLLTTELPDNVAEDIRDGYHRNLAVRVLNASVVTVRDPAALPALKKVLGPLVVDQLGDRVLLAAPGAGSKLLSRIKKAGLTSRNDVEEAGTELVVGNLVPAGPRPPAPPRAPYQVALPSGSATQLVELVVRGAWGTGRPVRLHYVSGRAPSGPNATIEMVVHQLDRRTVRGLRTDVTPPQWITVPLDAIDQAQLP
ncbi:MAG: hypothetical protein M0Z54_09815 [Thermaerobacter sp.]|nr:hypothetical protein [Thermaerobacter sp.]